MARVWTVVLSVWAMLAIVAVLAWSYRPAAAPPPAAAAQTLVVKGANGKQRVFLVQPAAAGAPHATTATSAAPRP
jgi:cyanate permease